MLMAELRNSDARIAATLPMASLREQSQTERTLASPSLYLIRINTLATLAAAKARKPKPHHLGTWSGENKSVPRHRAQHPKPH